MNKLDRLCKRAKQACAASASVGLVFSWMDGTPFAKWTLSTTTMNGKRTVQHFPTKDEAVQANDAAVLIVDETAYRPQIDRKGQRYEID